MKLKNFKLADTEEELTAYIETLVNSNDIDRVMFGRGTKALAIPFTQWFDAEVEKHGSEYPDVAHALEQVLSNIICTFIWHTLEPSCHEEYAIDFCAGMAAACCAALSKLQKEQPAAVA